MVQKHRLLLNEDFAFMIIKGLSFQKTEVIDWQLHQSMEDILLFHGEEALFAHYYNFHSNKNIFEYLMLQLLQFVLLSDSIQWSALTVGGMKMSSYLLAYDWQVTFYLLVVQVFSQYCRSVGIKAIIEMIRDCVLEA